MLPPSSQHLACARPSDPSHSNVARPTSPNPPDCCKQNMSVWPAFVFCPQSPVVFSSSQNQCVCRCCLWSCPFSDQGEGCQPGAGRRRQRRLREPNQEDQIWHQADQGVCVRLYFQSRSETFKPTLKLSVLFSLRCSKVLTRISKPSTLHPPLHSVAWLWRQTAKTISSQVPLFNLNST